MAEARDERARDRRERGEEDDEPVSMFDVGKMGGGFGVSGWVDRSCGIGDGGKVTFAGGPVRLRGDGFDTYALFRGQRKDTFLFHVRKPRAVVRFAVGEAAIRYIRAGGAMGMIGRGGGGRARRPPPKVWAVVGKQKAYFESGKLAGYHMQGTTKLRKATTRGERLCIDHPNVKGKLCFDKKDLTRVDAR